MILPSAGAAFTEPHFTATGSRGCAAIFLTRYQ
jgi:hypothetical protein